MEEGLKNLGAAVIMQAVRDYFAKSATPQSRALILKDLRSAWMYMLSGGTAAVVADQLEKNPEEIRKRLRKTEMEEV